MQNNIPTSAATPLLSAGIATGAPVGTDPRSAPALSAALGAGPVVDFASLLQGAQPVDGTPVAGSFLTAQALSGGAAAQNTDPSLSSLLEGGDATLAQLNPEQAAAGMMFTAGGATIATQSGAVTLAPLDEGSADGDTDSEGDLSALMQQLMAESDSMRQAMTAQDKLNGNGQDPAATQVQNGVLNRMSPVAQTGAQTAAGMMAKAQAQLQAQATSQMGPTAASAAATSGQSDAALSASEITGAAAQTTASDKAGNAQAQSLLMQTPQAQTAIARIAQTQLMQGQQGDGTEVQTGQLQAGQTATGQVQAGQVQAGQAANGQIPPQQLQGQFAQTQTQAQNQAQTALQAANLEQAPTMAAATALPAQQGAGATGSSKSHNVLTDAAYDPTGADGLDMGADTALKLDLKTEFKAALTPGVAQMQQSTAASALQANAQASVHAGAQASAQAQLAQANDQAAAALAQPAPSQTAAADAMQPQPPVPQQGAMARSLLMTDREWPSQLTAMIKEARDLTQGDIEIALQPERLGRMTIRMEMRENAVAVTIVTDNDASARLLNDNQARLADLMSKAGLDLSQHNASSGQQGGAQAGLGGQGGNGAPGQGQPGDANTLATAQVLGGEAGQMNTADDDDGIDILA